MNTIPPFSCTTTYEIAKIQIIIDKLILHESVTVVANCYDQSDNFLFQKRFCIDGEEYLAWGSDDNYLLNLIIAKIQFPELPTIVTISTEEPMISTEEPMNPF